MNHLYYVWNILSIFIVVVNVYVYECGTENMFFASASYNMCAVLVLYGGKNMRSSVDVIECTAPHSSMMTY